MTKATLKFTGEVSEFENRSLSRHFTEIYLFICQVFWEPPAIYKSSCEINVEYFPYDEQTCFMKFGSWTYNGAQVDLRHLDQVSDVFNAPTYDFFDCANLNGIQMPGSNIVAIGIDLKEFYPSVEWDILEIPAGRNEEYYPEFSEPFSGELQYFFLIKTKQTDRFISDITFKFTMRRKTLFYTVNLIIPCVALTFLTVLVFYLPSDSGEKVRLCRNFF